MDEEIGSRIRKLLARILKERLKSPELKARDILNYIIRNYGKTTWQLAEMIETMEDFVASMLEGDEIMPYAQIHLLAEGLGIPSEILYWRVLRRNGGEMSQRDRNAEALLKRVYPEYMN